MRIKSPGNTLFHYHQTPEQANEYLRLALAFLGKHNLTPNPVNYTLAYEYLLGRNPDLVDAMDNALAEGQLPSDMAIAMYCRFVLDSDSRRLEEIRSEMRALLLETLSGVQQASQNSTDSANKISDNTDRMSSNSTVEELRGIISDVVKETHTIAKNSNSLKSMLDDTRHEIESLREELDKTRQQATTDALTGLLNRRGFETALQLACTEASHHKQSLTMLMIDIDHFKQINDTLGHLTGDKVLRNVGTILSANIKGKDTVGRYGGEEFAVILTGTSLANAHQVAEILRLNIERSKLRHVAGNDDVVQVSVSIGVTEYIPGESTDDLVRRADEAMYQSKHQGRNRVTRLAPPL